MEQSKATQGVEVRQLAGHVAGRHSRGAPFCPFAKVRGEPMRLLTYSVWRKKELEAALTAEGSLGSSPFPLGRPS